MLVLELAPRPQQLLDFVPEENSLGTREKNMLADRQRLRHAWQELPVHNTQAVIALAQRMQAGFLDLSDGAFAPKTKKTTECAGQCTPPPLEWPSFRR